MCHVNLYLSGWSIDLDATRRDELAHARNAIQAARGDPDVLAYATSAFGVFSENIAAALALIDRALQSELCSWLVAERLAQTIGWAT
jgi:hypothetical protein